MCQEGKICYLGHPQIPWFYEARQGRATWYIDNSLRCFITSQCWSQTVVCVSTPGIYPRSLCKQILNYPKHLHAEIWTFSQSTSLNTHPQGLGILVQSKS